MMLVNRQRQRVLEDGLGFSVLTGGRQAFSQKDMDHHPIGFLGAKRPQMGDGLGIASRVHQGLRETESGQVVVGEPLIQLLGLRYACVVHGRRLYHIQFHRACLEWEREIFKRPT